MTVLAQIKGLTAPEALVAMEALWDRLRNSGKEIESPDWHGEELARRDAMIAAGTARLLDWNEAKQSIRNMVK